MQALPLLKKEVLVDAINLEGVKVNTGTFIEGMEIKGVLGRLYAKADRINLSKEQVTLNTIDLSDTAITLLLNDTTTKADTTSTPVNWILKLEKINFDRVAFAMQMPADSLRLTTYIDKANLKDGVVDLGTSQYGADLFTLTGSTLGYDGNDQEPVKGFDPSHIALSNVNITLDSLFYGGRDIKARIRELSADDRSGLAITSLTGSLHSDSTTISVPQLLLKTAASEARLLAMVPWSSFDENPEGDMRVLLTASLGKEDVMTFAGALPEDFQKAYPQKPVSLTAGVEGNLSSMLLRQLKAELPGTFRMDVSGTMKALTDSVRRSGKLDLKAKTGTLDFLLTMLPPAERHRYNIPAGITLTGEAALKNNEYQADLLLKEDKGKVLLTGRFNPAKEAYKACLRAAEYDTTGIKCPDLVLPHLMPKAKYYKNAIGYIPCDRENESVAKALEYAYDDWCISIFAEAMSDFESKAKYERFAKAYEFYFDKSIRFMRGLDSKGEWRTPFNPRASTHRSDDYCEGTAWQWTWFVPHDVEGLVNLMGGEDAFVQKLDSLFSADSSLEGETTSSDISGLIGQYAHGNEPSHHVIHLYNYVNHPWRTQELVDSVYRSQYTNSIDGLSGNEDCGQMSAWYILNSMGFYQVCPGKPVYSIGRPAFDKAVINLPEGKTFSIVVKNNGKKNKYIESVLLNGKALNIPFFNHQDIANGGTMEIKMTDHPTKWGVLSPALSSKEEE